MEQWKKYRWHIIFPIALTLIVLVVSLAVQGLGNRSSVSRCLALGEQCLNKMDYAGAILQFTNCITIDPNNRDARIGLADAYNKCGQFRLAETVIRDVIDENNPDPDLASKLIEVYTDEGNFTGAMAMAEKLINKTDNDSYREVLNRLLEQQAALPHPYAMGRSHELNITDNVLYAKGSNLFGQLDGMANVNGSSVPKAALFPGTPAQVYAVVNSTFVIDADGNLWGCGDNSYGITGAGFAAILPENGWTKLISTQDAAAVTGDGSTLYLLKTDGSLWTSAYTVGFRFTKVSFPHGSIAQIALSDSGLYVLNTQGTLYLYQSRIWSPVAQRVSNFSAFSYSLMWVNFDGYLGGLSQVMMPEKWSRSEEGLLIPDIELRAVAFDGTLYYLYDVHGNLYTLSPKNGKTERAKESQEGAAVKWIYEEYNHVFIVRKDTVIVK